jgi:NADPH:quinone reductase-like Zn-dependent oxidoreductase
MGVVGVYCMGVRGMACFMVPAYTRCCSTPDVAVHQARAGVSVSCITLMTTCLPADNNPPAAQAICDLISAGKVKLVVDHSVALEQVAEAHAFLEKGHVRGKVVLKVQDA